MINTLPRGIRHCNPGNIRHSSQKWQGQADVQSDPDFITFTKPEYGIRAIMKILETYYYKYSLLTIKMLISRYAPPNENDTASYISAVSKLSGVAPEYIIDDMHPLLIPLAKSIALHENGPAPEPLPAYWYPDTVYNTAKEMAIS